MLVEIYTKYWHDIYQPPVSERMATSLPYSHIQISKFHLLPRKFEQEYVLSQVLGVETDLPEVNRIGYEVLASNHSGDFLVTKDNPFLYIVDSRESRWESYWKSKHLHKLAIIGDTVRLERFVESLNFDAEYREDKYTAGELLLPNYDLCVIDRNRLKELDYLVKDYSRIVYI